ncbi:MAG TPA: PLDc N-terminal domain-containing protein [Solirubrobacteraceae bacterium]|nr:PLDc N-terminal domain-containing protein [Solirubrobacteraceae bacterium]
MPLTSARRLETNMVIANSYPFLEIFWTMILFFTWVIWIWIVITVLIDVFRRTELSGWAKAGWTVFVIVLPFIGVLVYLVTNGTGMSERRAM